MSLYAKSGFSIRYERRRNSSDSLLVTAESGTFTADEESFSVRSGGSLALPSLPDTVRHRAHVEQLTAAATHDSIEQLVIATGTTIHEWNEIRWSEDVDLMVMTFVDRRRRTRFTLIRGGRLDAAEIHGEVQSLLHAIDAPDALDASEAVLLEPAVAAELVRLLFDTNAGGISFEQRAPSFSERDGLGNLISPAPLLPTRMPATFYRPSYRFPPFRHALHVAARFDSMVEPAVPRLLALVRPPLLRGSTIQLDGLAAAREGAIVGRVAIALGDLTGIGSSSRPEWFPIAGGTWGQRLFVPDARLQPIVSAD